MNRKFNKSFKQGIFTPKNPEKCKLSKFVYRSSYELKFFVFCDENEKVVEWGAETKVIPYLCETDRKIHRYYIDNYVVFEKDGNREKYLIEIKPFRQTLPPKSSKKKKRDTIIYENLTYLKNISKWNAAKQYCKKFNYKWVILTEKGFYLEDKFYKQGFFGL